MIFEEVLMEAIDESFSSLGEKVKYAVYFHLENNYNIRKSTIPYRIGEFTEAIEDIFGLGAQLVEIRIMKTLYTRLRFNHLDLQNSDSLDFKSYLYAVQKKITRARRFAPVPFAKNILT